MRPLTAGAGTSARRHRQIRSGLSELDVTQDRDVTVAENGEDYLGQGRGRVGRCGRCWPVPAEYRLTAVTRDSLALGQVSVVGSQQDVLDPGGAER